MFQILLSMLIIYCCQFLTVVPDGFVMVSGGSIDGNSKTASVEVLDLQKTDSACGPIPEHGSTFTEGSLGYFDGKVLYCSYKCHYYVPGATEWVKVDTSNDMSRQRFASASSVIQGVWLISGGTTSGTTTDTPEYWDGTQFHPGPDMPHPMDRHCQVTISDSLVFFFTPKVDASDPVGRTFFLNWNDKSWETLDAGTRTGNRGTCGKVKTSANDWEIVVADKGTSSIFNLQTK